MQEYDNQVVKHEVVPKHLDLKEMHQECQGLKPFVAKELHESYLGEIGGEAKMLEDSENN
jgi:hypothetical protein